MAKATTYFLPGTSSMPPPFSLRLSVTDQVPPLLVASAVTADGFASVILSVIVPLSPTAAAPELRRACQYSNALPALLRYMVLPGGVALSMPAESLWQAPQQPARAATGSAASAIITVTRVSTPASIFALGCPAVENSMWTYMFWSSWPKAILAFTEPGLPAIGDGSFCLPDTRRAP